MDGAKNLFEVFEKLDQSAASLHDFENCKVLSIAIDKNENVMELELSSDKAFTDASVEALCSRIKEKYMPGGVKIGIKYEAVHDAAEKDDQPEEQIFLKDRPEEKSSEQFDREDEIRRLLSEETKGKAQNTGRNSKSNKV